MEIRLTIQEINIILQALGKRPFEEVYELIGNINNQVNQQLQKKEPK